MFCGRVTAGRPVFVTVGDGGVGGRTSVLLVDWDGGFGGITILVEGFSVQNVYLVNLGILEGGTGMVFPAGGTRGGRYFFKLSPLTCTFPLGPVTTNGPPVGGGTLMTCRGELSY